MKVTEKFVFYAVFLALAGTAALAANRGDTATSSSPFVKLKSVDIGDVRWTQGFWYDRFQLCDRVVVPQMWKVLQIPENGAVYKNLRIAAGLEKGTFSGKNWSDGDVYKWLEAVAHLYSVTHEKKLDVQMDEIIAVIGKAQAPDGYISTQTQLTGKKRWGQIGNHELYNMGHLLTAACIHHRATGKSNFLDIGRKVGDYLYAVFQPRPPELAHCDFNPSNIMGVVELYRTTRNPKYLELARVFVDMRGSAPGGSDETQSRVPLREETEAVGHAVTGPYLYAGATDVYSETGEKALLEALDRIYRNVTEKKMYITGGIGAWHLGRSGRKDPVHEAFGTEYSVPNRLAYSETCANIANAMWSWRMLEVTGEAKYADVMERVLYNSMLSGVGIGGTDFFYTNVLRRYANEMPLMRNDALQRWTDNSNNPYGFCCPASVARTLAKVQEWAYSVSDHGVWVNLYGSSVVKTKLPDGRSIEITQETGYPWDGRVKITNHSASREALDIMLRVPEWAQNTSIKVDGQAIQPGPKPATYAKVSRKWDVIELDFPMQPRLIESNPLLEETRGQLAVMRGPIVYCLESPDLPGGARVSEIRLRPDIQFKSRWESGLLSGVTVLEGEASLNREGQWSGVLYRPFRYNQSEKVNVRLIPYFAWANRGVSHMTVWIPQGR